MAQESSLSELLRENWINAEESSRGLSDDNLTNNIPTDERSERKNDITEHVASGDATVGNVVGRKLIKTEPLNQQWDWDEHNRQQLERQPQVRLTVNQFHQHHMASAQAQGAHEQMMQYDTYQRHIQIQAIMHQARLESERQVKIHNLHKNSSTESSLNESRRALRNLGEDLLDENILEGDEPTDETNRENNDSCEQPSPDECGAVSVAVPASETRPIAELSVTSQKMVTNWKEAECGVQEADAVLDDEAVETTTGRNTTAESMQFYNPARSTPPYGQYGHEDRQIMNLDQQPHQHQQQQQVQGQMQHNSSPTSSYINTQYPQMSSPYGAPPPRQIYPPHPSQMHHAPPASNAYYPQPHQMQHMHQPQAPMMPMQQQPYYGAPSPLTGTPPLVNFNSNGNGQVFNFNKRTNASGGNKKKSLEKHSSPTRYGSEDSGFSESSFPDMSDFPLLDVAQQTKKEKSGPGRKPCRPHLCEQSRMLIARVGQFNREFAKRLGSRHPLANSPISKADQWTSSQMGISLATVRKCMDMTSDTEVFMRCSDKNLVNLTHSEREYREDRLSKLAAVFEDEKVLGAGTAGLTIAEYSPRKSHSVGSRRQSSVEDKPIDGEKDPLNDDMPQDSEPVMENGCSGGTQEEEQPEKKEAEEEEPTEGVVKEKTPKREPAKKKGKKVTKEASVEKEKVDIGKKTDDEVGSESAEPEQIPATEGGEETHDDSASSEGNRSTSATPEPATANAGTKRRRATRKKSIEESTTVELKKKKMNSEEAKDETKPLTRARTRHP